MRTERMYGLETVMLKKKEQKSKVEVEVEDFKIFHCDQNGND